MTAMDPPPYLKDSVGAVVRPPLPEEKQQLWEVSHYLGLDRRPLHLGCSFEGPAGRVRWLNVGIRSGVLGFAMVCPDQGGGRQRGLTQDQPVQRMSFRFHLWPGRGRGSGPLFCRPRDQPVQNFPTRLVVLLQREGVGRAGGEHSR